MFFIYSVKTISRERVGSKPGSVLMSN